MGFKLYGKSEDVLNQVLESFKSGDVAGVIARTVIERQDDGIPRPIDSWSFNNRFLAMLLLQSDDCRGFKQWLSVGRVVRKGEKSGHILFPLFRKYENDKGETEGFLYGFKSCPVFSYEQTDELPKNKRKGLAYVAPDYTPSEPPPLADVAQAWGVNLQYAPYVPGSGRLGWATGEQIGLNSHDTDVLFHELGHIAETRLGQTKTKGGNEWDREVVAELTTAVLARMCGQSIDKDAFKYIERYAKDAGKNPHQACLSVLRRTKAAIDLILSTTTHAVAA